MGVQIVDILTRNDVYLVVPLAVKRAKLLKLLLLLFAELGELL